MSLPEFTWLKHRLVWIYLAETQVSLRVREQIALPCRRKCYLFDLMMSMETVLKAWGVSVQGEIH